ncbi:hypothetical protein GGR22_001347 [Flavobacterium gossypii]|uniref:Uncharacterized protein n=1 Tax=Flavobacterium gossypii TaxID=1646119 RepID=A0ABR6DPJ1_9FLAO|nr:hypothetical protein [Flavobacterium gossypii]MBA9073221.1 hypothetical protein [Flavobacterium gossypii]
MAIWQYTFQILPKESLSTLSADSYFGISENLFDDESYWKLYLIKRNFFHAIQKILPKNKSWSSEIDLYGHQESNCFEVISDNEGNVISVSFRIDFTTNYESILSNILEFCGLNGLVILDERIKIVPWNYEQAQSVIMTSPQVKKYNQLLKKGKDLGS